MPSTPEHHLGALALELRHELEGTYALNGDLQPGDLERRLSAVGIRKGRTPVPVDALPQLSPDDRAARKVVDAFLQSRAQAGVEQDLAIAELVRESAYTWANRLLALRCMEARELIDEVILQKAAYGGRSLQHSRLARKEPDRCAGEDDGLFAMLLDEFARRAEELPLVFDPSAPEIALRPSVAALKRCLALLSGTESVKGQDPATDELFKAKDALGWTYQYWNNEEKGRLFEAIRVKKVAKVGGADVIPATCIYTTSYMVEFLVQNSLGARWMAMHPGSKLSERWAYYVAQADPLPAPKKPVKELSFLDPACGSGHFLLEAFDVFYAMYLEEGEIDEPGAICASILANNLYGIDIDERAVQIGVLSLVMRAKEKARDFTPQRINLVATNIHLPSGREHLDAFLRKHPEDRPLEPALLAIFEGLGQTSELGSLLRIEEPVEAELQALRRRQGVEEQRRGAGTLFGPRGEDDWNSWKRDALDRLRRHFGEEAGASDLATAFFGEAATKGLSLVDLLTRRYDVVNMNPPYIGFRKLATHIKDQVVKDKLATQDIYVAFLSRFFSLLNEGGCLAAVSPSSWTTSSRTAKLRRKMLDEGGPRIVASLGQRVFDAAPLLFVSLQVLTRGKTRAPGQLVTLRPAPFSGQEGLLRAAQREAKQWPHEVIQDLEALPFFPVAPLELLQKSKAQPSVANFFSFLDGVWTGGNDRDFREAWEVRLDNPGWVPSSGGQGYARWYAPLLRRMRARDARAWPAFAARSLALEYSRVAGGKLAARLVRTPSAAIAGIVSILPEKGTDPRRVFEAAAVFNSRLGTIWLRTLTSGLNFNPGYAGRIPLATKAPSPALEEAVERVVSRKRALAERDLGCDDFSPGLLQGAGPGSLGARAARFCASVLEDTVLALEEEARIELLLKEHFAISEDAWAEIEAELGKPVASLPMSPSLEGAAALPVDSTEEDDEEEEDEVRTLPAESALEALARVHGLHPRALLAPQGLPAPLAAEVEALRNEQKLTFVQDYLFLLVLRLFGHRWPRDPEGAAALPGLLGEPDEDGIVPLTPGAGERVLLDRLRDVLAEDLAGEDAAAIERDIKLLLGKPLDRWLEGDFFKLQVTRFGKRPVLWQLQSSKYTTTKKPVFAAMIHAHRLDGDTIPKLRTQYLGPLKTRLETELRSLEAVGAVDRSRVESARHGEIEGMLRELRDFDTALEGVSLAGFACRELTAILAKEALDPWTSRDGRAAAPASREAFVAQERRYDPLADDGVRVNVAPLQKAGLLAADVLATKDMEKALVDRAEWRADERNQCRGSKLRRPGWWSGQGGSP